jgi:hypothetical protein
MEFILCSKIRVLSCRFDDRAPKIGLHPAAAEHEKNSTDSSSKLIAWISSTLRSLYLNFLSLFYCFDSILLFIVLNYQSTLSSVEVDINNLKNV